MKTSALILLSLIAVRTAISIWNVWFPNKEVKVFPPRIRNTVQPSKITITEKTKKMGIAEFRDAYNKNEYKK